MHPVGRYRAAFASVARRVILVLEGAVRRAEGRPPSKAIDQRAEVEADNNWFSFMLAEADRVGNKLHAALDPQLLVLFVLGGMLPNASTRINAEIGSAQDETDNAIFILNSRITTGCVATYVLAMRGLVTDSAATLRHVLESVGLAIAMMHTEGLAERWRQGRQYSPREVRALIKPFVDLQPMYKVLSKYAHANASGQTLYRTDTDRGYVVTYSGSYQPKHVAATLGALAEIELLYLRELYGRYHERLSIEAWPLMFELADRLIRTFQDWADALPDDWLALREQYATGRGLMNAPVIDPELRRQAVEALDQLKHRPPAGEN
ncbi:MAG TPA: hypothetical protein VGT60_10855 [Candidatus Limnocylindria bacterium]|nr:hypothetical protein [Candidatus Limnocylindria bacterium]